MEEARINNWPYTKHTLKPLHLEEVTQQEESFENKVFISYHLVLSKIAIFLLSGSHTLKSSPTQETPRKDPLKQPELEV